MRNNAAQYSIGLELALNCDIINLTTNIIKETDLVTLLAGLLEKSIIATKHCNNAALMYQPEVNQIVQIAKTQQTVIPHFNDDPPKKTNVGALVGGIVGGAAGLALLAGGVFFFVRRKRTGKKEG